MLAPDPDKMRAAGRAAAATLKLAGASLRPGMTTADINRIVHEDTIKRGGIPATLNYKCFPASCCVSVNDVVCHGIPGPLVIKEGDIVNIDVTTIIDGHYGDTNATFLVGEVDPKVKHLVAVTEQAMYAGIVQVRPGAMLGRVGAAIADVIMNHDYSIVREFGGHGIGRRFHLPPHVHHYGLGTEGPQLVPGMFFTIEPMVTMGSPKIFLEADGWTVRAQDGLPSAQFEHTIMVTETGYEIMTLAEDA